MYILLTNWIDNEKIVLLHLGVFPFLFKLQKKKKKKETFIERIFSRDEEKCRRVDESGKFEIGEWYQHRLDPW